MASSTSSETDNTTRPPLLPWSKQTWERWACIPRLHKSPIPRTKFLLLKAPASTLYEEKFLDRNMFTVPMYASRMTALGTAVGMVMDCTALDLQAFAPSPVPTLSKVSSSSTCSTIRYFHDVKEWDEFDIEYVRLIPPSSSAPAISSSTTTEPSPSHATCSIIPTQETINQFLQICTHYWQKNPDAYISIFDSRGGYGIASYLICCYMCVYLKAPVHAALASIENVLSTGTGTGLLDILLIQDLQHRYHGTRDIVFDSSKIPKWWWFREEEKKDDDDELNSTALMIRIPPVMSESKDTINTTTVQRETKETSNHHEARKRVRQEDIPALEPVSIDSSLYQRAKTVLDQLTTNHSGFPLLLMEEYPLTSSNASQLYSLNQKYKMSWISQGRRGLLLILTDNIFFIEVLSKAPSDSTSYMISLLQGGSMNFPLPDATPTASSSSNGKKQQQQQHRTLLDVVLVQDVEDSSSNTIQHRFMIRDILAHHGGIVSNKPFYQRLKYIMDGVIQPRKRDISFDYSQEPIRLRAYEFFDMDRLDYVVSEVSPKQNHPVKGIVMIPVDGPYYDSKDKKTLTWMLDSDLSKNELVDVVMGKESR